MRNQARRQAIQAHEQAIEDENVAGQIFDAVSKSIEDTTFANEIIDRLAHTEIDALNLATFGVHCINYDCLPQHRLSDKFIATGSEISDYVYYNPRRFYYSIRTGPFAGWCLKSKYVSRGFFIGGVLILH